MKATRFVIGWFFLLAMTACHTPVETRLIASQDPMASPLLTAVDSLMWQQPDSALTLLLPWFDTVHADETFNNHYANLLLSELLYKNDYAQTNRRELKAAVAYFDNMMQVPELVEGPTKKQMFFLTARAHYINGVGYYEQDSVVEACREYIRALEIMEERFEEKELVGHKAQFLAYTYNRLGDMFKEQLLSESTITCYKQALYYCRREPTSKYGTPVLLYNIGLQYDIVDQIDSAAFYYDEALANMPDSDNLHYRDLVANKTLFAYYNSDYNSDSLINGLKQLVALSTDEGEKATRLLTLGNVLFEEKRYDSSRVYLETVFEQQDDITSKIMAAENLCNIYRMTGDSVKAQKYASFLVGFTMSEIENKTDVSKVNEMFQGYLNQKQEQKAVQEQREAVLRTMKVLVSTGLLMVAIVITILWKKSKNRLARQEAKAQSEMEEKAMQHETELKRQQEESAQKIKAKDKQHEEAMKAEQRAHRMKQAALSGRLKRNNQELRELKDKIQLYEDSAFRPETQAVSFAEEPVYRLVMERVNKGQFLSQMDCTIYKEFALDKAQLIALREAVDRHFNQFTSRLAKAYPDLTKGDLDYCCLYLLGLTDADVAALLQKAYPTVSQRSRKMRAIFGNYAPLSNTLYSFAEDNLSI